MWCILRRPHFPPHQERVQETLGHGGGIWVRHPEQARVRSSFLPLFPGRDPGHSIQAGWGGVQPGDLRFPGLPGGKEEHPLGLAGLVNLSKLDFY